MKENFLYVSLILFGLTSCSTTEKAIQTAINPASLLIPKSTSKKTPSGGVTINCERGATCIVNEGKKSIIIVPNKVPDINNKKKAIKKIKHGKK